MVPHLDGCVRLSDANTASAFVCMVAVVLCARGGAQQNYVSNTNVSLISGG